MLKANWEGMIRLILLALESPSFETREFARNQLRAIAIWLDEKHIAYPWDPVESDDKALE